MKHKYIQVSIAASSDPTPKPEAVRKTQLFIKKLAEYRNEVILMTGGGGGLMTIASKIFAEHGGIVIGFIPLEMERIERSHYRWHPYNTIEIYASMSYQARSIPLVRSSDVLVCLGGNAGTLIEVLTAYLNQKPVVCIAGTGYLTDKIRYLLNSEGYIDDRKYVPIFVEEDPIKAAEKAYYLGKKYKEKQEVGG